MFSKLFIMRGLLWTQIFFAPLLASMQSLKFICISSWVAFRWLGQASQSTSQLAQSTCIVVNQVYIHGVQSKPGKWWTAVYGPSALYDCTDSHTWIAYKWWSHSGWHSNMDSIYVSDDFMLGLIELFSTLKWMIFIFLRQITTHCDNYTTFFH